MGNILTFVSVTLPSHLLIIFCNPIYIFYSAIHFMDDQIVSYAITFLSLAFFTKNILVWIQELIAINLGAKPYTTCCGWLIKLDTHLPKNSNRTNYDTYKSQSDWRLSIYKTHDGLTKADATEAVEAFLRITKTSLIDGSDVLLSGFGKFSVNDKKKRKGRNPQTGEQLILDARRVVTFKPSGILRNRVNGEE